MINKQQEKRQQTKHSSIALKCMYVSHPTTRSHRMFGCLIEYRPIFSDDMLTEYVKVHYFYYRIVKFLHIRYYLY